MLVWRTVWSTAGCKCSVFSQLKGDYFILSFHVGLILYWRKQQQPFKSLFFALSIWSVLMGRLTDGGVNPHSINSSWCEALASLKRYISFHCSPLDDCTHPQQRRDETCQCHSTMLSALFQQRAEDIQRDVTKREIFLFYWLLSHAHTITTEKYSAPVWLKSLSDSVCSVAGSAAVSDQA